jgi:hypothetical protein
VRRTGRLVRFLGPVVSPGWLNNQAFFFIVVKRHFVSQDDLASQGLGSHSATRIAAGLRVRAVRPRNEDTRAEPLKGRDIER